MLDTPSSIQGRPGWRAGASIAAVVVLLHGLLFDAVRPPAARLPDATAALQVRIVPPAARPAAAPETARLAPIVATPPDRFALAATLPPIPRLRPAATSPLLPVSMVEQVNHPAADTGAPAVVAALAPAAAPKEADTSAEVPVYRTRLPPPMMMRFELKRGMLAGIGALLWRPSGQQYELRLDGQVAGLPVLAQASRGVIDAAGIAPERFTDQRLRRGVQAANFQRDKQLVTFSSSNAEYPLVAGTQDRLSWMMQLAGVVAADPKRGRANGQVSLFVVGTRGEADTWVFDYTATENVATAQGPVRALKFTREPRRPYDSKVEIWLDPARHHVPIHARFTDGETLDLLLIGTEPA